MAPEVSTSPAQFMTNARVLHIQQLLEVTLMFKRVASAQDDIAALDELKRSALSFKPKGLFGGTLQASQFLAALSLNDLSGDPTLLQALDGAGLTQADVVSAQACATRFVGAVEA